MALMEEYVPGRTENLHDYLIPTIGDMPRDRVDPDRGSAIRVGPSGAKGIGEQALIPTAPAILGAIHHATGVRVHRVPATPHRVRAAIRAGGDAVMSELAERFETHDAGARRSATRSAAMPARCMCYIAAAAPAPATATPTSTAASCALDPLVLLEHAAASGGAAVPFAGDAEQLGRRAGRRTRRFVTGDRRRHDLSRLQAGALHRLARRSRASTWSPS